MDRSYLVEMVSALGDEEAREFEIFLTSPYENRNKHLAGTSALFKVIRNSIGTDGDPELDKEEVYRLVFGDSRWVEGRLEKLMAELNKLLRAFLLQRYYFREENEYEQQLDLARILQEKGMGHRQSQILGRLRASQERFPWKDADFYFRQFRLEFAEYEIESIFNQKNNDLNIPAVLRSLDLFYHLHRINLLNHYLLQGKMTNLDVPDDIQILTAGLPVPASYLGQSANLLISTKVNRLLSMEHHARGDFDDLADLLAQHAHEIEKQALQQYYAYLRSLCVMFITEGNETLFPVLHRLLKDNLSRGYLYPPDEGNRLPPSTLLNIVSVSIRVREFDWLHLFLEEHKDRIIGDNENRDLYRLNKAACLFAQRQYNEALDWIPASSPYVDYHLAARRLEIKAYYEMDSDLLLYKMDAFKMFVSRASKKFLSDGMRKRNADFVNFVYQLTKSNPGDAARADRLLQRIAEKKWAADREWLVEKVEEIKRKKA